jgi:hypothetical protein
MASKEDDRVSAMSGSQIRSAGIHDLGPASTPLQTGSNDTAASPSTLVLIELKSGISAGRCHQS